MLSLLCRTLFPESQTINQSLKFGDDRLRLHFEEPAPRVENPIEFGSEGVQIYGAQAKSLTDQTFCPVACDGVARQFARGGDAQTVLSEPVCQNKDRHQTAVEAPPVLINRAEFNGIP